MKVFLRSAVSAILLLLLLASCQKEASPQPQSSPSQVELSAWIDLDGVLLPFQSGLRSDALTPLNEAWLLRGVGLYDYDTEVRLAFERVPGTTGTAFNESGTWKVASVYFDGFVPSGLPGSFFDFASWSGFPQLFTSSGITFKIKGDTRLIVKMVKGDGVDVVTE